MNRKTNLQYLSNGQKWDIMVIGGGATGLGIALDAASRGYKTFLCEKGDFAQGTSSKSTKLIHGGVRYLKQGNIKLVLEALKERGILFKNAPHLIHNQEFIIPFYTWWDFLLYSIGLRFYDTLSGKWSMGKSKNLSRISVMNKLPNVKTEKLKGGIRYFDGQFDDARLAISLAQTAVDYGACLINYMETTAITKTGEGKIRGIELIDHITGQTYSIQGKILINATGVYSNAIAKLDDAMAKPHLSPSQGIHLVLDKSFLPSSSALMIPETPDGRVLFAIPWQNKLILGTTDTPVNDIELNPAPLKTEIDFILNTASSYLIHKPAYKDIESIYVGLRPLAARTKENSSTKEISRSHKIWVSDSGMVNIIGGKWTTYRIMAEETLNFALKKSDLPFLACLTTQIKLHGYTEDKPYDYTAIYGSDRVSVLKLAHSDEKLLEKIHPEYPFIQAEILWAIRNEMAMNLTDLLGRRFRWLFLNVAIAREVAPGVAKIMAEEMGMGENWQNDQIKEFYETSNHYLAAAAH